MKSVDKTWLDDLGKLVTLPFELLNGWYDMIEVVGSCMAGVRRAMEHTWLRRADSEDFDELRALYATAREIADPELILPYPDDDELRELLDAGSMWVLREREDDRAVGACSLTNEAVFRESDQMIYRGRECLAHTPGENWYHPGEKYLKIDREAVVPPLEPVDLHSLIEYAARAASTMGIYELRVRVSTGDLERAHTFRHMGFKNVGLVLTPRGERFCGLIVRRAPWGVKLGTEHGYCPVEYEWMTDEEYAARLKWLGVEKEEFVESRFYREKEDDEDGGDKSDRE